MAYEPRPGSLSLFKNDRKEKESHPDYKGDGLLPDGTPAWISAWLKTSSKGTKFFSISVQAKDGAASAPVQDGRTVRADPLGDDPFADDVPF
jgi:uncharacterized protein (DUF736 family)